MKKRGRPKQGEHTSLYARIPSDLLKRVDKARIAEDLTWKALIVNLFEEFLERHEDAKQLGSRGYFRK